MMRQPVSKNQPKPPNILREIQRNKVAPVYLLSGEERFLIEGTLKQMLDSLLTPETRDFNLSFLEGSAVTMREILSQVELYPVMSKWRIVVVYEPQIFKTKQSATPITLLRNAVKLEKEDTQKCITTATKLLEVTGGQIAEQHPDFTDAAAAIIEELGNKLTDSEREFLERLPEIAAKVEVHSTDIGATDDAELLLEWLQGELPKTSILILTVGRTVNERSRIVKAIQKIGRYVSFKPLERGKSLNQDPLYKKVTEKLAEFNKQITPRAFEQLRMRTGGDMQTTAEAINKIVNFVGDKHQVDEKDVRNMVTQNAFNRIFDLTDAIGKRSLAQALKSLHEVLASGEPHLKVNTLIIRQLRLALQAKLITTKKKLKPIGRRMPPYAFDNEIFKPLAQEISGLLPKTAETNILKQNPYAAYKIFQTLPAFTNEELITALEKALEADIRLKTDQLDATCILEELVCELCHSPKGRRRP